MVIALIIHLYHVALRTLISVLRIAFASRYHKAEAGPDGGYGQAVLLSRQHHDLQSMVRVWRRYTRHLPQFIQAQLD